MGQPYVVLLRNGTATYSLALARLHNRTTSYCPVGQLDSLDLARLRNRTNSYCPVGQRDSLDLARLRNGTAASLPGCVTGLPRCVTGYRGFGVVHPDSRLHNGAPRYVTGIPIRNRTSWVSVWNIYIHACRCMTTWTT